MKKVISLVLVMLIATSAFALRVKSGDVSRKVVFTAYASADVNNVTPVTSLTTPHVTYSVDGAAKVYVASPTVAVLDAVNAPGSFILSLDQAGMATLPADTNEAQLYIYVKSDNAFGVPINIELYKDDTAGLLSYGVAKTSDITDYNAPTFAEMSSAIAALNDLSKDDVNDCVVGVDWSRVAEPNSPVYLRRTKIQRVSDANAGNPEGKAFRKIRDSVTVQQ